MRETLLLRSVLFLLVGCKTSGSSGGADAAGPPANETTTPPTTTMTPASGPFTAGNNRATLSGKPFPTFEGPRDEGAKLRKAIPVKLSKPNPEVTLGRGFLLRERKEDDRARWFVMRVENKTARILWAVKTVFAQFRDEADNPVGGGHNVYVHGSVCDTVKNAHLGIPGVGAFLNDECLGPGEAGWAVIDLANERECAASHPCAPGAADLGSVELQVWADGAWPVVGPATRLVPTSYAASADRVLVTLSSSGPNPTVPFLVQGLGLDASGEPLFFLSFTLDRKTRIAPGGTLDVTATQAYRGPAATRMDAWTVFIETPAAP
jgi:hypothetical protein